MDAADKAIGPSAALTVNSGDRVELESWVRYRKETDYTNGIPALMLSQLLGGTFAGTGGFEGLHLRSRLVTLKPPLATVASAATDRMRQLLLRILISFCLMKIF